MHFYAYIQITASQFVDKLCNASTSAAQPK